MDSLGIIQGTVLASRVLEALATSLPSPHDSRGRRTGARSEAGSLRARIASGPHFGMCFRSNLDASIGESVCVCIHLCVYVYIYIYI